ncbi:peptidyl-prolyl cis-trans isomerase C [Carboxydocella sporoproducens DSM 16521]|uniref:peptidylprolyl isomerase n=2 Tax=Carboxydocella TaxID=178898 RepID=A0A1T4SG68_9FIRM|nr:MULTISPECIES: peptidylprolyl isomerase [Carboxydocella]AVX19285.1 peptidyl-prolyl cis-trans isomerase C [Carboxydocella thermautotrophica]AVX29700.1 peptidyl-prolyl cis-trans isomerase C [Carboxydocella thermautotrophica]SKA26791.1 peptidyl-prolyl cis-trans isomerase C [Carboxydocella sporoproducens DSM 16521]
MYKLKKLVASVLTAAMLALVAGCGSNAVATVNGEDITKEQFERRLEKMKAVYKQNGANFDTEQGKAMLKAIQKQVLDGMIEETILLQEAKKQGVLPSDADVQKRVEETIKKFESKEKFLEALKNYNMDEKEFAEWTKQNLALDALYNKVTANIKVTDEEIKKYYEENKEQFKQPEQVRARHILIKFDTQQEKVGRTEEQAKKMAQDLIKELEKGADFAKLAKEKSEDPGSKDNGGEYTFSRGQMVQEFEDAAFSLKPGSFTKEPVKTQYGYHIIKVEERIPAKERTFEEVKGELALQLPMQKKQEAFAKYTAELKSKAKIEIKDKELAASPAPAPSNGSQLPPGHPSTSGGSSSAPQPAKPAQ